MNTTLSLRQKGAASKNPHVEVSDFAVREDRGLSLVGRAVAEDNGFLAVRYPSRKETWVYKLGPKDNRKESTLVTAERVLII